MGTSHFMWKILVIIKYLSYQEQILYLKLNQKMMILKATSVGELSQCFFFRKGHIWPWEHFASSCSIQDGVRIHFQVQITLVIFVLAVILQSFCIVLFCSLIFLLLGNQFCGLNLKCWCDDIFSFAYHQRGFGTSRTVNELN